MSAKKFIQTFLLIAILFASFASTTVALAASCGTSYTVVRGDTLRKIADFCGTTVAALRLANPEIGAGNLIYPNQVLLMPGAILYGDNGYDTYVVARGDTLKALALRFGTAVDVLLSLNKGISNANVIYEGQQLVVPSGRAVPVPPPSSGGQVYTVRRGDTLRKIAARVNTTVDAILKVNPKISNPDLIYVGQVINLPAGLSAYVVQRGDTLKAIALRFGTTLDSLLALNPTITNADRIYVGQVIRIW